MLPGFVRGVQDLSCTGRDLGVAVCIIDPPVTACMRRLWMGYRFDGFQGSAGSVRIGIGIAGL